MQEKAKNRSGLKFLGIRKTVLARRRFGLVLCLSLLPVLKALYLSLLGKYIAILGI